MNHPYVAPKFRERWLLSDAWGICCLFIIALCLSEVAPANAQTQVPPPASSNTRPRRRGPASGHRSWTTTKTSRSDGWQQSDTASTQTTRPFGLVQCGCDHSHRSFNHCAPWIGRCIPETLIERTRQKNVLFETLGYEDKHSTSSSYNCARLLCALPDIASTRPKHAIRG